MSSAGRVFMLDDDQIFLELYENLLESKGYEIFATDNAYKFLMYGRELNPDVMFLDVNMPRLSGWDVLERIANDDILQDIPVVMLTVSQDEDLAMVKGAAHFLYKPLVVEEMTEILESYCRGGKNHDILLLEDYEPMFYNLAQFIRQNHRSCFCTHNLRAAKRYLQKNEPKKIAVRYCPERFEEVRQNLNKDNLFRVEDENDLAKIL